MNKRVRKPEITKHPRNRISLTANSRFTTNYRNVNARTRITFRLAFSRVKRPFPHINFADNKSRRAGHVMWHEGIGMVFDPLNFGSRQCQKVLLRSSAQEQKSFFDTRPFEWRAPARLGRTVLTCNPSLPNRRYPTGFASKKIRKHYDRTTGSV